MNYKSAISMVLFVLFIAFAFSSFAENQPKFIENKGQFPEQVEYKLRVANADVFFEKDRLTFNFFSPELFSDEHHEHEHDNDLGNHAYQLRFINSSESVAVKASGNKYKDYINYISKDVQVGHVNSFDRIKYEGIFPGVDFEYYGSNGRLKYDVSIAPNVSPELIKFSFEGADRFQLKDSKLVVKNRYNTVEEYIPLAYQIINGRQVQVECRYTLDENIIGFEFPNGLDPAYHTVIDPEIIFVSYSGSTSDNFGFTATYDDNGSLYGGGIVFGPGYPYVAGSYSSEFVGTSNLPAVNSYDTIVDIGISKFSADGTTLLYSTYISGSSAEAPHSIVVNSQGELVILGSTSSPDFPVTELAYDTTFNGGNAVWYLNNGMNYTNGSDIFVTVLSADGSTVVGSTFLGGSANDGINPSGSLKYNYNDLFRGEVIVDDADNIFITSTALSNDFPVTVGAHDETFGGTQDAVVAKFNSNLSSLDWCTYVGGMGDDSGYSIKVNANGDVYVTGGTTSNDLQVGTSPYLSTYQGGSADGYVYQLSSDGSNLINGTYVGTTAYDQSYFVEIDDDQEVYLYGQTLGAYPVSNGVHFNANGKQFIQKLTSDLSTSVYSTVFGSGSSAVNISPTAFLVDICERVYISGWGGSTNSDTNPAAGNTLNMEVTNDAEQATTDGNDFYFMVLEAEATSLLYGSYLGGPNTAEHVDGGTSRFDKNGVIYQAVCASCRSANDFPTTPGAWSEVDSSIQWFNNQAISGCNLGVIKLAMELSTVDVQITSGSNSIGCAPLQVQFESAISNASEFTWFFHNGDSSSLENPTYTYQNPGVYEVLLVGSGTLSCTGTPFTDTAIAVITVSELVDAAEAGVGDHLCPGESVELGDTAIAGYTYSWSPNEGLSEDTVAQPMASPDQDTQYFLTITNPDNCQDTDSVTVTVFGVTAFPDTTICLNDSILVTAVGGTTFSWEPTDGVSNPNIPNPYITAGFTELYTVTASDGVCEDTANLQISSVPAPTALFYVEISQSCLGDSVHFINLSDGADDYQWNIGGEPTTEFEPVLLFEPEEGPVVTLTAFNANGECADSLTIDYANGWYTEDSVSVFFPTVITPNGDDINDCFRPAFQGDLEDCFTLKVFSRWGRLLYDSEKHGGNCWDGTQRTGDLVSEGTYYFIANVRGMDYAGYMTVLYE